MALKEEIAQETKSTLDVTWPDKICEFLLALLKVFLADIKGIPIMGY
jgi:hypothetical protein